ncbi:hypothetical protein E2C01_101675 [Portunus trituberculatus]|uniref:Uncharacterized protein n=1 Tax=Portunus trituberculatus TaxID=210409 RepID=A0A5B7KBB4_PORTR|nr:hypothetical protein [Portunus trituberculatus]
MLPCARPAR